jgi:hypothetical protein
MDPVSLSLGVIPLVASALKGYRAALEKFSLVSNYSREVNRLASDLEIQRVIFQDSCQIFMHSMMNEHETEQMFNPNERMSWSNINWEPKAKDMLKGNYKSCRELIEKIISTLVDIKKMLDSFSKNPANGQVRCREK